MTVTTTAPVKTGFVGAAETSEVGAINDLAGFVAQDDGWADTVDTAGGTLTISAAAMVNGSYRITGGTTSTITTDTAANIIAALKNAQGGKRFDFLLVNGRLWHGDHVGWNRGYHRWDFRPNHRQEPAVHWCCHRCGHGFADRSLERVSLRSPAAGEPS
jgi:hypothetical protein